MFASLLNCSNKVFGIKERMLYLPVDTELSRNPFPVFSKGELEKTTRPASPESPRAAAAVYHGKIGVIIWDVCWTQGEK
jgi:hypothetical protein